ncbi:hypothetical protein CEUSTIGMA_g390.t1 [Chlamydomonas eustigma]|uniref:Rrn7/TAF1B N-terminal cyclin domain-containing protein n=1 Tax=Chlamydomonas eustigma TaxID=1157962 RepID=A0A250WQ09_9CHLO|nr:hypothetical protein CEUSTIGMA_g390.t1 [Chlamydomonas eustigma]|eukprot:GAX72935.1 hypothetical protein CEUSTIGMA_g390.t1 [Chlamydomonas eustigma]
MQQAPVEEEEAPEQGERVTVGGRRRMNTGADPAAPSNHHLFADKVADRESEQLQLTALAHNYVKCLQLLLQAQAEALVHQLGMPAALAPLVRNIWFSYLPLTGFLDIDLDYMMLTRSKVKAAERARRNSVRREEERHASSTASSSTEADGEGQHREDGGAARVEEDLIAGFTGAVEGRGEEGVSNRQLLAGEAIHPSRITNAFRRKLPLTTTLVICYLACLSLRLPITPTDISRWAIQGHLPLLDLPQRCRELLSSLHSGERPPVAVITASGAIHPNRLIASAMKLAAVLKHPIPNLNGELLILKCCAELRMPQGIFLVAKELYRMYFLDSPLMNLSAVSKTSSPYLFVVTIACVALRFGYGIGGGHITATRLSSLPPPPKSWIDWAEACLESPACRPLNLPTMARAGQLSGRDVRSYLAYCKETVFAPGDCQGCPKSLMQVRDHLEEAGKGGHDSNNPSSSRIASRATAIPTYDALRQSSEVEGILELDPSASEHLYTYTKIAYNATQPASAHPDLLALVAVGAAYLNVKPSLLMQSMATLERHMMKVDTEYGLYRTALHHASRAGVQNPRSEHGHGS